ncbi:unnamed protein product [Rhizoctonia solani]|uniref:F-box domain-containing protein n=1 Tax=Rhizoctonia solani TaxID=456999 RepID=A0A8H2Y2A2_9AGAM|nr:unnamed protein product [Rhizoctonia solani]
MSHTARQSKIKPRIAVSAEQVETGTVNEGTSAGGSVAPVASAPPRKQARTTKNNRSKKKKEKSISGLLKLPVELFTEIMHYLKPVDVLKVSRTCKSFRGILMRRSSESIWKRAAENLSFRLPPPPPWLDMPQFVSVVFTPDCSACGGKAVPKESKWDPEFHPVLLIRLCVGCQPSVLVSDSEIPGHLKPLVTITHVNIFPGPDITMPCGSYALLGEVQKLEKQYNVNKKLKDESRFSAWERAKSKVVTNYSKASGVPGKLISDTGRAHWELIENVEKDRERQKSELKYQFQRDVERRLKELGWEHDINEAEGKEWRSLTRQPRNLTDRIWNNLYPKLQKLLEEARSQRLDELPVWKQVYLAKLWHERHHDLRTQAIVHHRHIGPALQTIGIRLAPPASEAMEWPQIKQVLDLCPSHHEIKVRLLESWENIHPLAETWQRNVEAQLASRLQGDSFTKSPAPDASGLVISGQPVLDDLDILLRADSVFKYSSDMVRYFPDDFLELWDPPFWILDACLVTSPSVIAGAQPFTLGRNLAKDLLRYLGHPNATHLSMNTYGKRFVCGACAHSVNTSGSVYDWKGLLNHYINASLEKPKTDGNNPDLYDLKLLDVLRRRHHPQFTGGDLFPLVHILTVDDARKYAKNESNLMVEAPWSSYKEKYACLHCPECDASELPVVVGHVQYIHYVMEPQAHRDYESHEVYIQQSLEANYEYGSEVTSG